MNSGKEFSRLYKSPERVVENIRNVFNKCDENELLNGKDWYKHANLFSLALAETYKISEMKVAGIISALSPQKDWLHNKVLAEEFLRTNGKISRHTSLQTNKARRILHHSSSKEDIEKYLNGLKTINFFNNIFNPLSREHVTVDRHHIYLSVGWDAQTCTPKQYEFLKENTVIFAKEVDMIPSELQSTLWVCWKRLKKNEAKTRKNI